MGHADEIAGGARALWDQLKGSKAKLSDDYARERDTSRAAFARDQAANPTAYGVGNVAGGIGTQAALTALTGGTSLAAQGAMAAGLGAINAEGESDKIDAGEIAKGGAEGLAAMGLGHLVGKYGAKAVNAALRKAAPALADKLDQVALAQGRRAIAGGDENLRSRIPLSDQAVKTALDTGAIQVGDTTKSIADKLSAMSEAQGAKLGGITKGLEDAGVQGPSAQELANRFGARADSIRENSLNSNVPKLYEGAQGDITTKALDEDGRLSLTKAEQLKRDAQGNVKYGLLEDRPANEAHADIASTLRQANEDAINSQTQAAQAHLAKLQGMDTSTMGPDALAYHQSELDRLQKIADLGNQFKPAKELASDLYAANDVAQRGASKAANRRLLSPTDNLYAAAGLASGHPLTAAAGMGNHIARAYGPAAVASVANSLSKKLGKVGTYAALNPQALGKWGGVLAQAYGRSQDEGNAKTWVLNNTDPDFQKHIDSLPDHDGGN